VLRIPTETCFWAGWRRREEFLAGLVGVSVFMGLLGA
jgi:hypothetical protein